uniref:Uncharacterized protein n=1 Tax=Anguilla anguilla TaxID=7936 RepID=A0A0E9V3B6_ANGAN
MPAEYNVRMQVFCVWKPLENRHVFWLIFVHPLQKLTKVQKRVNSVTIWFLQCYNKGCPHGKQCLKLTNRVPLVILNIYLHYNEL